MMRSLYSGISGLVNHQTRMDVIANNIANVNTVGFKRSRTIFQDVYSQTAIQGSAGTAQLGGTNTSQVGLGVKLSAIDVIHTSSSIARSDYGLDVMIDGDGFFILNTKITGRPDVEEDADGNKLPREDPDGFDGIGYEYFTRAGDLRLDNNDMLVSSHGYYVMGYWLEYDDTTEEYVPDRTQEDADGNPILFAIDTVGYEDVAIDSKGVVWGIDSSGTKVPFAQLAVATFSNNGGLEKRGSSLYGETGSSGPVQYKLAGEPGVGIIGTGGTEMSNVDLATEFTDMIVTQRGFQANSRIITVSDTMLEELVNLKR